MGTVNQEKQLERIADALEEINTNLSCIDDKLGILMNCVGYVPPRPHQSQGYHFLRIAGQIDAD